MTMISTIDTDGKRSARMAEIEVERRAEEKARDKAKKNPPDWVQVTGKGFDKMRGISERSNGAIRLYMLLGQHITQNCGVVVASQAFLADELGISTRSIRRYVEILEEEKMLVKIPIQGRVYAYAFNPYLIWKGRHDRRGAAAFHSMTLANIDDTIKRSLKVLAKSQEHMPKIGFNNNSPIEYESIIESVEEAGE